MESVMSRVMMDVSAGLMFAAVVACWRHRFSRAGRAGDEAEMFEGRGQSGDGPRALHDPLGAAVEPRPPEAALPCKKPEEARGQWSYSPNCTPEIEGM